MIAVVDATDADVAAITALFNHEIRTGVALWNTRERTEAEMTDWISARRVAGGVVVSARDVDGRWLGYGGYGQFRPHDGYANSVEHSLYVAEPARGRGVGRALLRDLERRARAGGKHVMIGGADASNAASIALHLGAGFIETARMPDVGRKFDRWLTLVLMQKILD